MLYQALYRKYRPKTFDEVCGQKVVVTTLKNAIKYNKLTHAYLFIGPRGTGKTSIAKIFAKTINCENQKDGLSCEKCDICKMSNNNENIDIIEMDAASNNSVDEIREIRNHITLMPTFSKYKIYIIDEVHMLTSGAFNTLLKTLEEPPKHVIFILATTEPQKVPLTILSRCQCFEFKPIPENLMTLNINNICKKEKIKIEEEAVKQICEDSNGGMRDAIGLLDQLNAYTNGDIKVDDVLTINGRINNDNIREIFNDIKENNLVSLFDKSDKFDNDGKDFILICEDIVNFLRNSLVDYQINNKNEFVEKYGKDTITKIIFEITDYITYIRNISDKKIYFDLLLIKIYDIINHTNVRNINNTNENMVEKKQELNEEPKIEASTNKKEENSKIQKDNDNKYEDYFKLMKIRQNNILCDADKSVNSYKKLFIELESNIDNLEERQLYNLLMDCNIVAGSPNGIVITASSNNILEELFENINKIEKLFLDKWESELEVCFLTDDEWKDTAEDFRKRIRNKEKIDKIDETEVINNIKQKNNKNKSEFEDLLEIGE